MKVVLDETALNIFSDGSSFSGPRAGGIGIVFVVVNAAGEEEVVNEFNYPGYRQATNNQMELHACITALEEALDNSVFQHFEKIVIHSDSKYVVDNYMSAIYTWPNSHWTNKQSGRPILHVEQWKKLVKLIKRAHQNRKKVLTKWVKGHSTSKYNRAADKLAKQSARNPLNKPLTVVSVRRKKTSESVHRGSVKMQGQEMVVRIVSTERLKAQGLWTYKYEVKSDDGSFGPMDIIFSEVALRDGHVYRIRCNSNTDNPRIEQLLEEVL